MGRLAALEATIAAWSRARSRRSSLARGLRHAQPAHDVRRAQSVPGESSRIIDALRTLLGGLPLQMPASIDILGEPELKDRFERWWKTPTLDAGRRMKLYKLAWDLVGSEFAGRHQLYEKFYAGNSIVVRNQSDREAPWQKFHAVVDGLIERIDNEGPAA